MNHTSHGSWVQRAPGNGASPEHAVREYLSASTGLTEVERSDTVVDLIVNRYTDAINGALTEVGDGEVTLNGNQFYGPAESDTTPQDIGYVVADVDLGDIVREVFEKLNDEATDDLTAGARGFYEARSRALSAKYARLLADVETNLRRTRGATEEFTTYTARLRDDAAALHECAFELAFVDQALSFFTPPT